MKLRERERFLKLSDLPVDDCQQDEVGWLSTWETESGGAVIDMTTSAEKTLAAIKAWADENEELAGRVDLRTVDGKWVMELDGQPMSFEAVMEIVNNFR